jgi:hypothetical protein
MECRDCEWFVPLCEVRSVAVTIGVCKDSSNPHCDHVLFHLHKCDKQAAQPIVAADAIEQYGWIPEDISILPSDEGRG